MTLNLAAFDTEIGDYQATVVNGSVGVIRGYLASVDKVRSQGFEIDLTVRPVRELDVYASLAYTDAKCVRFPGAPPPIELSGGPLLSVDASGGALPGVSKYAISYGGEYRIPARPFAVAGSFYVGYDGNLRSDFSSSATLSTVRNVDGYTLANVRAGFRTDTGSEVVGWLRNAFDVTY